MISWPVQPRAGFTGLPNEILARALGDLTGDQLRLFLGLVYGAEFGREGKISPDGRWRIGWALVLVSYDSLALAYRIKVDAVRRALRRLEQLGLASVRRAAPPEWSSTPIGCASPRPIASLPLAAARGRDPVGFTHVSMEILRG